MRPLQLRGCVLFRSRMLDSTKLSPTSSRPGLVERCVDAKESPAFDRGSDKHQTKAPPGLGFGRRYASFTAIRRLWGTGEALKERADPAKVAPAVSLKVSSMGVTPMGRRSPKRLIRAVKGIAYPTTVAASTETRQYTAADILTGTTRIERARLTIAVTGPRSTNW
jgi:hypothetical protein